MRFPSFMKRHCAHGCFYWTECSEEAMLVLDTLEMKFSIVGLPPGNFRRYKSIVEAAEGRLGLLTLAHCELRLYTKPRRDSGAGAEEWWYDGIIPLSNCYWSISSGGAPEGYVLLRGMTRDQHHSRKSPGEKPDVQYFTLQIKTMLLERLCVLKFEASVDFLYASFPPPLSPPSNVIQSSSRT